MATQKKSRIIDLSELFPEDASAAAVEVSLEDEVQVLTYTPPTHLALSLRDNVCRHCGNIEREQLGIFLEYHEAGAMRLTRLPREATLENYSYLPRRVDYAPPDSVPACSLCWFTEALIAAAEPRAIAADATPCSPISDVTPEARPLTGNVIIDGNYPDNGLNARSML